jgi:DNA-binding MarR family transcriptional regulator
MTRLTPLEQAIAERGGHVGEARDRYPHRPGWSEPDTSRKASKSMEPHLGRLQSLVLAAISACPRTARELEADLDMRTQTVTARIRELVLLGKVEDSGLRRMTDSGRRAKVWREK